MTNSLLILTVVFLICGCSRQSEITTSSDANRFRIAAKDISHISFTLVNKLSFSLGTDPSALPPAPSVAKLQLTSTKADEFRKFTQTHLNQQIQIVSGTNVVAEPMIRSVIADGNIELHFNSGDEAKKFTDSLK